MTPSASLLQHLDHADAEADVDVDMSTAPDEWAFFPAPASRMSRRGRLKLVKAARDADRAAGAADQDATPVEPAVEEPPVALATPEAAPAPVLPAPSRARVIPAAPAAPVARQPFADDAPTAGDDGDHDVDEFDGDDSDEPSMDVTDVDEPATDEDFTPPAVSLSFESTADDEPTTPDEEPIGDDEPIRDAQSDAVYEPASLTEITALVETDDVEPSVVDERSDESASDHVADVADVKKRSPRKPAAPRKPAQRKPAQRKPAQRKPAAPKPAARKASGSRPSTAPKGRATDRPRVAGPKTGSVPVENETPAPSADAPARKGSAKRFLVAALALVVIVAGAVVGFLAMRDGTPASPQPVAVDVLSRYAQGAEGVTDGAALGFRAVFPGSPQRESVELPGPDEDTTIRYEWLSFSSGDVEFNAGRIAYPDAVDVSDASSVLRKAADGAARAQDGKVESYGEMTANGDPAAESVVSTKDGTYLRTHAVLHDDTLYLVRVESKVQAQPGFDRFVDSFEVI